MGTQYEVSVRSRRFLQPYFPLLVPVRHSYTDFYDEGRKWVIFGHHVKLNKTVAYSFSTFFFPKRDKGSTIREFSAVKRKEISQIL